MVEINPLGANLPNALLPTGRIVGGHPMTKSAVKDERTGAPKLDSLGNQRMSTYFGIAIPKAGETHWNQTQWGALIWNEGAAGFPRGEYQSPTFAWKITDGDSGIPNKKGRIPNQQEGYAGHWVLNISTELEPPKCYKLVQNPLNPNGAVALQELTSEKQLKKGDYGRVSLVVKANCDKNGNAQTPGVYLNPTGFCMDKEGDEIVSESSVHVDAAAAFGGTVMAPAMTPPPSAPVTPVMPNHTYMAATPPPPPSAPAAMTPPPPPSAPRTYQLNGFGYSKEQLLQAGYTEEYINALP